MKTYVCFAAIVLAAPLIFGFAKAHAQSIGLPASPPTVASRQPMSSTPSPAAKLGALMTVARAQTAQPSQAEAIPASTGGRAEPAYRAEPARASSSPQRRSGPILAAMDLR